MNSQPDIDFQRIRPHKHTRHGGFEELCVQLFKADIKDAVEFTRIEGAGGDGGVEAFAVLKGGQEVGLQAKYFDKLDPKKWRQIDKSVKTALRNHPKIVEYRIAAPLNRTPAQKKEWGNRVKKWQAGLKRRKIKFVWVGCSELEDTLTNSNHTAKLLYWFGCEEFTEKWIDDSNSIALTDLDCRYTPKKHVRTEGENLVNAFTSNPEFTREYYRRAKKACEHIRRLYNHIQSETHQKVAASQCKAYAAAFLSWTRALGNNQTLPDFEFLLKLSDSLETAGDDLQIQIEKLNRPAERMVQAPNPPLKLNETPSQKPYDYSLTLTNRAWDALHRFKSFLNQYSCVSSQKLIVIGEAGVGKSHLLARAVNDARKQGNAAILLLGEYFLSTTEPWEQVIAKLGWSGTVEELLSSLNSAAEIAGVPALICIDALNESAERSLWKSHLNGFSKRLEKFPKVRLMVSCRKDFVQLTLPDSVAKGQDYTWSKFEYQGFGDELFDAVATYFSGYNIQSDHFPPLLDEFRNPLFLKTFCEAYENEKLPSGPVALDTVMKRKVAKLCNKLVRDIDCPETVSRTAIDLAAELIEKSDHLRISKSELRPKIDALFPAGESKSLYRHLLSNGFFVEVGALTYDGETTVEVRFPYERFSDYFIADRMLRRFKSVATLRRVWKKEGLLERFTSLPDAYALRGVMRMLSILLPERFKIEFSDLISSAKLTREMLEDFLSSLPWRNPDSFDENSRRLARLSQQLGLGAFLESLLRVSTIPNHPYNAHFLNERLSRIPMAVRDKVWTIEISKLTVWRSQAMPDLIVKWAFLVPLHLISNEQAFLSAKVLAWFSSSNHRGFRLRAALASIRLLQGRCDIASRLLVNFKNCDDAYVKEHVFAVACGVAMREKSPENLEKLGEIVYGIVFKNKQVIPHIQIRDYANCIMELCNNRNCLPSKVNTSSFRPPYRSIWPSIWNESKVAKFENKDEWRQIKRSVQPESANWMYGDFGRYVMQSAVHQFSNHTLKKSSPKSREELFDPMIARRWVLQRVKKFGWTPKLFGKYEDNLPFRGRQREDIENVRIERISKKYQWIALRELQAYLSDHYHLALDYGETKPTQFEGAWQLWARDFDPSQPLRDLPDDESEDSSNQIEEQNFWWNTYPDQFRDAKLVSNRDAWVTRTPDDFRSLIIFSSVAEKTGAFFCLGGYYRWKEELSHNQVERDVGRLEMWAHLRTWLVKKDHMKPFLKEAARVHFFGEGCMLTNVSGWMCEYPWRKSVRVIREICADQDRWLKNTKTPAVQALCSHEGPNWGLFPSPQLCDILGARWSGSDFDFVNKSDLLVSFSPTSCHKGQTPPCFVVQNELIDALDKNGWSIVWAVLGQRYCFSSEGHKHIAKNDAQFSALYHLSDGKLVGGITQHLISPIPRQTQTQAQAKKTRSVESKFSTKFLENFLKAQSTDK